MKNLLVLAIASLSSLSYGSYTVCSSPNFYYSSVRHDFGTPPPPGSETGKLTIAKDGKTLVSKTFYSGEGAYSLPRYVVEFVGPKEVIKEEGVEVAGSAVYTDVAVLRTAKPFEEKEVLRTRVLCENTWAFVP